MVNLGRAFQQVLTRYEPEPVPEPEEKPAEQVPAQDSWKIAQERQRQLETERKKAQEKLRRDLAMSWQDSGYEKTPVQENWKEVLQRQNKK